MKLSVKNTDLWIQRELVSVESLGEKKTIHVKRHITETQEASGKMLTKSFSPPEGRH